MQSPDMQQDGWTLRRGARIGLVIAAATGMLLAALLLPPVAQPLDYHAFADARPLFGIANFFNVATNLPFLGIGIAGLNFVLRDAQASCAFGDGRERWPYAVLWLAVSLTAFGSAFYHLDPDNARLIWDRLPMAVGFITLVAAVVAERVDVDASLRLLVPLVALGAASVAWWKISADHGAENLTPYVVVQFGSIGIVILICALFPSRYTRSDDLLIVFGLYAAAKTAEFFDQALYAAGSILSGHSLKHLLAAAAAWQILRTLKLRAIRDGVAF